MDIKFAIITCSDTRDVTEDEAGAALESLIREAGWSVCAHDVVHDDMREISSPYAPRPTTWRQTSCSPVAARVFPRVT